MTTPPPNRITEQLAQEARAMEARMLPSHGPLAQQHYAQVRSQFAAHVAETGRTLPEVARMIGCTEGALAKFALDKTVYDATMDAFIRQVNRWLLQQSFDGGVTTPAEMVKTTVTDRILGVIHQTNRLKSMAAIVGPSGTGKSTVFKACAAGLVPGAVHVELASVDASRSALVARLNMELRGTRRYRMQESFGWIIEHLQQTRRMLIIDEAHYLSEQAAMTLRDVHKRTGCPVILGGTQDILSTINDFGSFHGQFKRLVSMVYNITEECMATGRPLYTIDEVTAFATEMGIRLTLDAADESTGLANLLGWGGLGALGYLLINAHTLALREANTQGKSLSRVHVHGKHVQSALRQMEGASGLDRVKERMANQPQRMVKTA